MKDDNDGREKLSPSSLDGAGIFGMENFSRPISAGENRLLQLSNQCRDHIKEIVNRLLLHEQDTPVLKAEWTWAVTIGTLAWDVSASAILLFGLREFRAGKILSRVLRDYGVRLEYYFHNPEKALKDFENAEASLWKFVRPYQAVDPEQAWDQFRDRFDDAKTSRRQTKQMMESNLNAAEESPERIKQMLEYAYDREYGIGSALAHGNEGSVVDVFSQLPGEAKHHQWHSRNVHAETLIIDIADSLLGVIRGLAFMTGQAVEYERLFYEMKAILKAGGKPER